MLSVAGVPWFVARVPTDYFSRRELERMHITPAPRSLWRIVGRVLKNLLGLVLVLAGIAMIFCPAKVCSRSSSGCFCWNSPENAGSSGG